MEDEIGSIEVRKYADIAICDKDLYTIPTHEIREMSCQMNLLGGKVVYKAEEIPTSVSPEKT